MAFSAHQGHLGSWPETGTKGSWVEKKVLSKSMKRNRQVRLIFVEKYILAKKHKLCLKICFESKIDNLCRKIYNLKSKIENLYLKVENLEFRKIFFQPKQATCAEKYILKSKIDNVCRKDLFFGGKYRISTNICWGRKQTTYAEKYILGRKWTSCVETYIFRWKIHNLCSKNFLGRKQTIFVENLF